MAMATDEDEDFPDYQRDALKGAIHAQDQRARAVIQYAFAAASSFKVSWKERYKLVDLAMLELGATRGPTRPGQDTMYRFKCGCSYYLHFAEPRSAFVCAVHQRFRDAPSRSDDAMIAGCLGSIILIAALINESWRVAAAALVVTFVPFIVRKSRSARQKLIAWTHGRRESHEDMS